jgi:hypothetical protein
VVPVTAPYGGVFHPKVWVLRFRDTASDEPRLRGLVLSRNLTHDRSWDTVLRLDSTVRGGKTLPGLARFVEALPDLAIAPLDSERREALLALAGDLETVRFAPPPDLDLFAFHALGLGPAAAPPLPKGGERLLVVSPFLDGALLDRLPRGRLRNVLVSRPDELDALGAQRVSDFETFVLSDVAEPGEAAEASAEQDIRGIADPKTTLRGLHAKLYVTQVGARVTILTGSANATSAAFSRNVEVLVEMRGVSDTKDVIDRLLAGEQDRRGLQRFLLSYTPGDGEEEGLDALEGQALDRARRALAAHRYVARVQERSSGYRVTLTSDEPIRRLLARDDRVRVWPLTVPAQRRADPFDEQGRLSAGFDLSFEGLTAFFVLELDRGEVPTATVIAAELEGQPVDREQRLLAALIGDADRFLRYLLLLLAGSDDHEFSMLLAKVDAARDGYRPSDPWEDFPLLEVLLRALVSDRERLQEVARLVDDLQRIHAAELVPEDFRKVWAIVWEVAREAPRG